MSKHDWAQVDHGEYRCRGCKETAFDGDFPPAHESECPMAIPAPEGEVPPRIFVGRQWPDARFKSGTWRKEQAAFYAVPFVPESALLRAVEEAYEAAAKEAESWMGMFNLESFDDKDVRRVANPNQIAARIRNLASRAAKEQS